jgi:glycosyltransferase involved in cell wall biosynthesis
VRLAIVTPWYGRELIGGAERHAWDLAHALVRVGAEVEVLTTCGRSFRDDWAANFHRRGTTRDAEGVAVRRFALDPRDRVAFTRVNAALTSMPRAALRGDRTLLEPARAQTFVNDNINSRALLTYLRDQGGSYDAVVFMPYLYGPTLQGVPLVAERAFLIPCLHDEAYAYLEPVRAAFAAARGVLFNSAGEEETASAIYGPGVLAKSRVAGNAASPVVPPAKPVAPGGFVPQRSRYVLYLGRADASKNVPFLLAAFRAFRERKPATSLQLVLAGPRAAPHRGDGVVDLGAVDDAAKDALLTYARALAQPSLHESFSRVMYEAWSVRRPVLVHGDCRATALAMEAARGGWTATTLDEWAGLFAMLDESADAVVDAAGARGWAAAAENGTWDDVARRVLSAIRERLAPPPAAYVANAVSPALWDGQRPAHERWAGGGAVLLSIAPLDTAAVRPLLETFVAFLGRTPGARLLIFAADCTGDARERLVRERDELDLADRIELVDDAPAERYAAYRAATLALALGRPLTYDAAVLPLWFDLPVIALADPVVAQTIEACGIVVDAVQPQRIAALARVIGADPRLRAAIVAEGRRVRLRYAPGAAAAGARDLLAGPASNDVRP